MASAPTTHVLVDAVLDRAKSGAWRVTTSNLRMLALDPTLRLTVLCPRDRVADLPDLGPSGRCVPVGARPEDPIRNILWHALVLGRHFRRTGADVLYVPSHQLLVPRGVPAVLEVADLTEFHLADHYDRWRMAYRRWAVPRNLRRARIIATPTEATRRDIEQFMAIPASRVHVVPHGVERALTPPPRHDAVALVARRFDIARPFVLYVGQIHMPNKNLVRLVDAFADLAGPEDMGVDLVLAGRPGHDAGLVRDAIDRHALTARIHMTGFVSDDELAALYAACECLALVSLREGFGLPLMEAMGAGVACITSRGTSLEELGEGAAVLVDPASTTQIRDGLRQVLTDPSLRTTLQEAGRRRAAEYTWERSARGLAHAFHQAAHGT